MKNLAKMYYVWPAMILVGLSLVALMALGAASTYAENSAVDTVMVRVPVACSLSHTLDNAHTASMQVGQYKENIGTTTFTALCNDTTGFAIYAIGYSADTYGNTTMINTVDDTKVINTGTNTSGSPSAWAMKLTPVDGTYTPTIENGYNNYSVVPATYTKVATFDRAVDLTIGASVQSTYAVNVSSTEIAGTYVGKVKYTLVHPNDADPPTQPYAAEPGCISYWPNASSVLDSMANDCNFGSRYGNRVSATLWASNFQRSGYGFAGWSDKFNWALNENDANGNGTGVNAGYHIYGPNATITTPSDMTDNGLSLYAVWVKSSGNLQNWNGCSSLTTGQVTALTDARDNNTYAVAKLTDGKCWMIENLRLADQTLATTDTNNPLNNGTDVTLKNTDGATTNHLSASTNPTTTAWCEEYYGSGCVNQSMLYAGNTTNPATNMTAQTGQNIYSYGNYYNWYSATAGNGTLSFSANNSSVVGDICPSGWHLPRGGRATVPAGQNGDFYVLVTTLAGEAPNNPSNGYAYYDGTPGTNASNKLRGFPNNFVYSGYARGSTVNDLGGGGYYWSSTTYGSSSAYNLLFSSARVRPGTDDDNKSDGWVVRCTLGS